MSDVFYPFLNNHNVKIIGVEAGGKGIKTKEHAASLSKGKPGFLYGNYTYLLQNKDGQIDDAHSISAGLDYPGIGPEHSWLKEVGRIKYENATDKEALELLNHFFAKVDSDKKSELKLSKAKKRVCNIDIN